jgi:PAS domain S-box-containing protein
MNTFIDRSPVRLLLVDDDQVDRLACKRALAQHPDCQFAVLEAETGRQGLELARTEQPDCILLDYYLPDLNGVEFLSALAEETGDLPVPVVMLTGADNAMVAVDALKRGARDYVVKDAEQEALQWLPAVVIRALREQQNIKEKAQAVEQLRAAEAKYRTLVEQIPAITYIAALEAPVQLLYISPQTHQLGYPPEDWVGDPQGLLAWVHPEDRERVMEQFAKAYGQHAPVRCEYRMIARDGRTRWFLNKANIVRDDDRRPLFLQGVLIDITEDKEAEQELEYYRRRLEELVAQRTAQLEKQTELLQAANANMDKELCERKRAEAALRVSDGYFRLLLESACEGIIGLDADGRCIFVNQTAVERLGFAREELLGQDVCSRIHHRADGLPAPEKEWSIQEAFRTGASHRTTEILWRKNGPPFLAECSTHPMRMKGRIMGAVLMFRETTGAPVAAQWSRTDIRNGASKGENSPHR